MKKTRLLTAALVLALFVTSMFGASASASGAEPKPETLTISFFGCADNLTSPENDKSFKAATDATKVTLTPQAVTWNDYNEKYKLWAASKQLPDVMLYEMPSGATVSQWIKNGLVREIPEEMYSKYPRLNALMTADTSVISKVDGKYYGIPRVGVETRDDQPLGRGYIVRKDWMDALGIAIPKTYEEYLDMFKQFANNDPDKNGKADTIGMTTNFLDVLCTTLKLGSDVPNMGGSNNVGWMKEDGQWIPAIKSKGMQDYVTKFRQLYAEGALDPDFALLKVNDGMQKFATGNVGALNIQISYSTQKAVQIAWEGFPHDKSWDESIIILPGWTAPDGNQYKFQALPYYTCLYFNKSLSDEKLDAFLRYEEYLLSDEAKNMFTYGFEGDDYKVDNGKISIIPTDVPLNKKYLYIGGAGFINGIGLGSATDKDVLSATFGAENVSRSFDMKEAYMANGTSFPVNYSIETLATPNKLLVNAMNWEDAVIRIALGTDDPYKMWQEEYAKFDQAAIDGAIKEVNDFAAANNIQ